MHDKTGVLVTAERGLAFPGTDEVLGKQSNGHFLGLLELIRFFLANHIAKYGNQGPGWPPSCLAQFGMNDKVGLRSTILDEARWIRLGIQRLNSQLFSL